MIRSTLSARGELGKALARYRREFMTAGLFSAVVNLLMLVPTLYMLQVFDRVLLSRNELTLLMVTLLTLFLFVIMALADWSRARLLVHISSRLDQSLSSRVFHASFTSHLAASSKGSRPLQDLLELRQFMTGPGILGFFDLPWIPIYLAVLFLLHPILGYAALGFAGLQGLLAWWGQRVSRAPARQAQEAQQESQQFLQGKLRNAEAVEAMGMLPHLLARWRQRHHQAWLRQEASQRVNHTTVAASKWLRYAQQTLALGLGALLVIDGELTAGAMIASNALMTRTLAPIDQLAGAWRQFGAARQAYERIEQLLQAHPQQLASPVRDRPQGHLQLRRVMATAAARPQPILENIDLELKPGSVTVLLGPSGSGKSTLARVAIGIKEAQEGQVLMDGQRLDDWSRDELGPHLGYLPQDVELFEGTLAENIARLGSVDPERVVAAAQSAGLHDAILRLPKGYDTPIGVGGNVLSGGMRQRVALARAMYGDPVLVVLDEPNANLDDVGERALDQAVARMKQRGQTVLLITHRPGAIALADQLVLLKEGHIEHAGPRDVVLKALRQAVPATTA